MKVSENVIKAERQLYTEGTGILHELDALIDVITIENGIDRVDLYATISFMFDDIIMGKGL